MVYSRLDGEVTDTDSPGLARLVDLLHRRPCLAEVYSMVDFQIAILVHGERVVVCTQTQTLGQDFRRSGRTDLRRRPSLVASA